jgi:hypothetical protein
MKRILSIIWVVMASILLICGCATQDMFKHGGASPTDEKIKIYPEPPQKAYQIISTINANTYIEDFSSPQEAEQAALKKLKHKAEKSGADGIIEVYIELLEDGEVVSSRAWSATTQIDISPIQSSLGGGCGLPPSINLKGKAIQFLD